MFPLSSPPNLPLPNLILSLDAWYLRFPLRPCDSPFLSLFPAQIAKISWEAKSVFPLGSLECGGREREGKLVGLRGRGEQMETNYSFMQREAQESWWCCLVDLELEIQRGFKKKGEERDACKRHPVLTAVLILANKLLVS